MNILFSSAGRRVELIRCFQNAAYSLRLQTRFFAADVAPEWSPACQVVDEWIQVPRCSDKNFVPTILEYCRQHEISLIIPTIDTELSIYAAQTELFKNHEVDILVPSIDFVQMTRNKIDTAKYLNQIGIKTPKTWTSLEKKEGFTYPLIAKPIDGSCSVGLAILENEHELEQLDGDHYEYMFQEKCSGEEYTVNAYYEGGCFRCAVPHHRVKTRSGEVLFGETVRTPVLEDIAAKLANGPLAVNGVICFQAFCTENANVANVIEINSRFGGGYPLCDQAGGTFARWILQKNATGKSDANNMDWKSGVRMLRYDAAVFYDRHESRVNAFCS